MPAVKVDIDQEKVDEVVDRAGADPESLIGILQDIQDEWHFLPIAAMKRVAECLDIPETRVWAVATFYEAFTLEPKGLVHFIVCTGTACHVRGAEDVVRALEDELMVEAGHTTPDGEYSIETAHCLGACAMGPVVVVNDEYHGHMSRTKILELLGEIRAGRGTASK
jgi:NADH-quinone oxidoreductase subunit E